MADPLVNINEVLETHINILYQIKEKIGTVAFKSVWQTLVKETDEKVKAAVSKINAMTVAWSDANTILTDVMDEI